MEKLSSVLGRSVLWEFRISPGLQSLSDNPALMQEFDCGPSAPGVGSSHRAKGHQLVFKEEKKLKRRKLENHRQLPGGNL